MGRARQRLLEIFKERAFSVGKFTLASGKESAYYLDAKRALFNSEAACLLSDVLWDMTRKLDIDAVGGLEVGALPLTTLLAECYGRRGLPLEGFFVRKQPKEHGSKSMIEGGLQPGMRVCVLDDVLTTGNSALQAIAEIEEIGATVVAVVCIVDRLEGAREALGARYDLRSIFTIRDFGVAG